MDLSVKYDTLQLAQQLLERQAGTHLTNIQSFMDEWCHVDPTQAAAAATRIGIAPQVNKLAGRAGQSAAKIGQEVAKTGQSTFQKGMSVAKQGYATAKQGYAAAKPGLSVAKGVLFILFTPVNEAIVAGGHGAMDLLITCHQGAADKLAQTVDAYAEADKAAYEALTAPLQTVGIPTSPFEDPRDNPAQLGDARTKAGSHYGGGDPRVDQQLAEDKLETGEYLSSLKDRAKQRVADATSSDRSIAESQDASSYLVPPEAPTSEMENLRWSAGVVAGSVDWAIEKLTGMSLLNDVIFKYFSGDWRLVDMASSAWSEIGDALVAVGQNDSETLPALAEWTGKGSEVANLFIATLSQITTSLRSAASLMSTLLKMFAKFLKQSAKDVGAAIKEIVNTVLRLIAESSIPIAGWVSGAIDAISHIDDVISWIRKIYTIINFIVDFIEGLVRGKAQMLEVQNTMSNLAEAAVRGAAARV